jgi:hypothetical protein
MKKTFITLLSLMLLACLALRSEELITYESEEKINEAVTDFAELFSKGNFLEAFNTLHNEENALRSYEHIRGMESSIKELKSDPSISIEVVSFGDNFRSYGVLIFFGNGLIMFSEMQYFNAAGKWRNLNVNLQIKGKFSEIRDKIPEYYLKHHKLHPNGSESVQI